MLYSHSKRAPRGSGRPWAKELGAKKALRADGRETDEYRVFSLKEGRLPGALAQERSVSRPVSDEDYPSAPTQWNRVSRFWVQVMGGMLLEGYPPVQPVVAITTCPS